MLLTVLYLCNVLSVNAMTTFLGVYFNKCWMDY